MEIIRQAASQPTGSGADPNSDLLKLQAETNAIQQRVNNEQAQTIDVAWKLITGAKESLSKEVTALRKEEAELRKTQEQLAKERSKIDNNLKNLVEEEAKVQQLRSTVEAREKSNTEQELNLIEKERQTTQLRQDLEVRIGSRSPEEFLQEVRALAEVSASDKRAAEELSQNVDRLRDAVNEVTKFTLPDFMRKPDWESFKMRILQTNQGNPRAGLLFPYFHLFCAAYVANDLDRVCDCLDEIGKLVYSQFPQDGDQYARRLAKGFNEMAQETFEVNVVSQNQPTSAQTMIFQQGIRTVTSVHGWWVDAKREGSIKKAVVK